MNQNPEDRPRHRDNGSDGKIDRAGKNNPGHAETSQDHRRHVRPAAPEHVTKGAALLEEQGDGDQQNKIARSQEGEALQERT